MKSESARMQAVNDRVSGRSRSARRIYRPQMRRRLNQAPEGDCLKILSETPRECVGLVVTSPPYNLKNSSGNGLKNGRGAVGKTAVIGAKDRKTNKVKARAVSDVDRPTMHDFIHGATDDAAQVCTDDARGYQGMNRAHEAVRHSVGEYVCGQAHTNGIESFRAMLKRGHNGAFHKISPKHPPRCVAEFAGRHNHRSGDTADPMAGIVENMEGRRLRDRDLVADNGSPSGAQ